MKQGFSAGCSLDVTLKFADFQNVKPGFWCGITEEWDTDVEGKKSEEELLERIDTVQKACRRICEEKVDIDIYDVCNVKLYQQILEAKSNKKPASKR